MQLVSLTTIRIATGRSFQPFFDVCQWLLQQLASFSHVYEFLGKCPITKPLKPLRHFVISFQRFWFALPPAACKSPERIVESRLIDDADLLEADQKRYRAYPVYAFELDQFPITEGLSPFTYCAYQMIFRHQEGSREDI